MDRKEAIEILENWVSSSRRTEKRLGYINGWFYEEDEEAFRMAIEALQKYDDCVEAFKELLELKVLTEGNQCTHCLYNPEHPFTVNCSEIPKGSLISRQDAIDAVADGLKGVFVEYRDVAEKLIGKLPSAEPRTGRCASCKRSSDYCSTPDEDKTRCPIEEHYALPKDGYCHLYEQI